VALIEDGRLVSREAEKHSFRPARPAVRRPADESARTVGRTTGCRGDQRMARASAQVLLRHRGRLCPASIQASCGPEGCWDIRWRSSAPAKSDHTCTWPPPWDRLRPGRAPMKTMHLKWSGSQVRVFVREHAHLGTRGERYRERGATRAGCNASSSTGIASASASVGHGRVSRALPVPRLWVSATAPSTPGREREQLILLLTGYVATESAPTLSGVC
jgi:hypothetical protein